MHRSKRGKQHKYQLKYQNIPYQNQNFISISTKKVYFFVFFLQIGKCMCEKVPFSRACSSFYGSLRIIKANPCQKNPTIIAKEDCPHFCRLIPKITAIFEVQLHKLHYLFLLSNFCKIYGLPRFLLIHSL